MIPPSSGKSPRRIFPALLVLILAGASQAAPDPTSPRTLAGRTNLSLPGQDWKLIFSDEFNGSRVDWTKWRPNLPWAGAEDGHWHTNGYASYLTLEDISVSGGQLKLACRKTPTRGKTRTFDYTAGMVTTSDSFRFVYGFAEVSARAPMEAGPGLWPAFWTLSQGWPPEFDIIELWTGGPRIHQGYCYAKPSGQGWDSHHDKIGPTGFHTYAMEWGPGYVFFLIDGKVTKRIYGDHITDKPQYLLLNSAVCSGKGNAGPSPETRFPNSFDVDYCRVYARPYEVAFHNGGFEGDNAAPWKLSPAARVSAGAGRNGSKGLVLAQGPQWAEQKIYGLTPGARYALTGWARSNDPRNPLRAGVKKFGGSEVSVDIPSASWKPFSVTFTAGLSDRTGVGYCYNPEGAGGAFDDIRVEKIP